MEIENNEQVKILEMKEETAEETKNKKHFANKIQTRTVSKRTINCETADEPTDTTESRDEKTICDSASFITKTDVEGHEQQILNQNTHFLSHTTLNTDQIRKQKNKHIVTKHNEYQNTNERGFITDNERKTFRTTCPVCQFTVPSQCNLKLHMQAKCDVK